MGGVGFSPRSWNHLPVAAKNTAPPCIINISLCLFLVLGLHPKASDPIYTSLPIYILPSKVSLTHCHSKAWDHMSMVALVKENPMVTWIKKLTNSHIQCCSLSMLQQVFHGMPWETPKYTPILFFIIKNH